MPPGHVAVTWGVAKLFEPTQRRLIRFDYRILGFCSLAPDFIDKPLAIFVFTEAHTSQLIAHSLPLNFLLLLLTLLFWRAGLPYTLAFNAHLVADRVWNHTETYWWPFYGWSTFWEFKFMNTPQAMLNVYLDILVRYPQVWVIELIALAFLGWFVYQYRLYQFPTLKRFLFTGQVTLAKSTERTTRTITHFFLTFFGHSDKEG